MISTVTDPLQFPEPEKDRWTPLRVGLLNIWEYDEQVFVFHKGRLLLRGRNEAGKSKALEVLFPFLLDANLAPARLDPFGTTSRDMFWNLLGHTPSDAQVAIGYVWMEFGRRGQDAAAFFTTGAGLRAVRSTREVRPWYFTTPLRVGRDLALASPSREPLSRRALEETLGPRGNVVERAGDYRRAANHVLFGMGQEQYDALVNALLHLRRPQLSRTLDPDQLSGFLTESLPPLEDKVIQQVAEGFERLDRHQQERDAVERSLKLIQGFETLYRDYLRIVAKSKTEAVTSAESAYHKRREELRVAEEVHRAHVALQAEIETQIVTLEAQKQRLYGKLEALRASDEFRAAEEIDRANEEARQQTARVEEAIHRRDRERGRLERFTVRLREKQEALDRALREMARRLEVARTAAVGAGFDAAHGVMAQAAERAEIESARTVLDTLLRKRREAVSEVERAAAETEGFQADLKRAKERLADAEEALRQALERAGEARRKEGEARKTYVGRLEAWLATLRLLGPLPDVSAAMEDDDFDRPPALVTAAADRKRQALIAQAEEAATRVQKTEEEVFRLQTERDALLAETHRRPEAPVWRAERPSDRSGAALYMLCDFSTDLPAIQAGIEAALQAAGFLDAWVTPEGVVLDRQTEDTLFEVKPVGGRTLADFLRPTECGGVAPERVMQVLQTVQVVEGEPPPDGTCWIALDGRWGNGPLRGAWTKGAAEYIGESARARARERRLLELSALLGVSEKARAAAVARREAIRNDLADFENEVRTLPPLTEVHEARFGVIGAEKEAGRRSATRDEAGRNATIAGERFERARAQRDALASERGLSPWVNALGELKNRTFEYQTAGIEAIGAAREAASARAAAEEIRQETDEAAGSVRMAEEALRVAGERREFLEGRATELKERLGKSHEEILRRAREIQAEREGVEKEIPTAWQRKADTQEAVGASKTAVAQAEAHVAEEDARRRAAEKSFRDFTASGLLAAAGLSPEKGVAEWTFTDALLEARRVGAATEGVDASDPARQRAENRALERHNDLILSLPSEIRLKATREEGGAWIYLCVLNGRTSPLGEMVLHLADDLSHRERRLAEDERKLLEDFLSGETREHLRRRLRDARALVDRMNGQLERRPTPSGVKLRLRWEVGEEERAETRRAIDLLMKSPALMTDVDRKALEAYLRERLKTAREGERHVALADRMRQILDYRQWHVFDVLFKADGADWKRLTKKAHEAGSGGQKAMMLHLPLFAAAAAFYDSAAPGSARIVALDEAFAGIDRRARGQLMGLAAVFDLDLIMTSFEEWGCYEELDGLSIYHLSREQGFRGVYTERFLWDGTRRVEVAGG